MKSASIVYLVYLLGNSLISESLASLVLFIQQISLMLVDTCNINSMVSHCNTITPEPGMVEGNTHVYLSHALHAAVPSISPHSKQITTLRLSPLRTNSLLEFGTAIMFQ